MKYGIKRKKYYSFIIYFSILFIFINKYVKIRYSSKFKTIRIICYLINLNEYIKVDMILLKLLEVGNSYERKCCNCRR